MALYLYKGIKRNGKNISGTIDAENIRAAKLRLKKEGVYVSHIKDKKKKASGKSGTTGHKKKVPIDDLSMMTRQLATLIKANIPLVDSLHAVSEQVENPILSEIISEARDNVKEGGTFHKALAKYPMIFTKIYVSMVEAGEASGTLDTILLRLADFTEAQSKLSRKVKGAMAYPVAMFVFTILMLMGLFVFVIPKITGVFDSFPELVLPWYSVIVIDISEFMVEYWIAVIVFITAFIFLVRMWLRTDGGERTYDKQILNVPVIGKLARMLAVSRFTRTLSTLLDGGVPMLNAMSIVRNVVDNQIIAEAIDSAKNNISEGESIAGPLKASGQFPPIVIHMINIGEKTGELENMLTQVSDAYDFQVSNQIDALTSLLEPLMLIVMGALIGIIVLSVMIPIFQISSIGG